MGAEKARVPVLLTNPSDRDYDMAARRKTRRKTTRRTTRRRTTRRTTRRRTTRRRRKNPTMDLMGTLVAGVAGAAVGGAQYFLDGQDQKPMTQAAIMAAVGGLGGLGLGMVSESAAKGVAGAGLGFAAYIAIREYMAKQAASEKTQTEGLRYQLAGAHPSAMGAVGVNLPQLAAVGVDLGAVGYDMQDLQGLRYQMAGA